MGILMRRTGNLENALLSPWLSQGDEEQWLVLPVVPQGRYSGCSRGALKKERAVPMEYKLRTPFGSEKEDNKILVYN